MMNYEIFKEVVAEKFMDYLPEPYKNMKVEVRPVDKINSVKDGLTLLSVDNSVSAAPTIYMNDMYEEYQKTDDLSGTLQKSAEYMVEAVRGMPDISKVIDMHDAKDSIVFQLVNTEQNKEMLAGTPHREIQDLSIIYRWVIKVEDTGIQSAVIHDPLAERLGFNEEQMFKLAAENTRRLFPPTVKSMNDVIRDIFMKDGMPPEIADMMLGEMSADQSMWVITNDRCINGAISMLYEDKLYTLAKDLDTDLYIMPSSIHEVIAVSASMGDPNELAQMVAEVNMDHVSLDERLSNQVYHYDKDLRKLTLATDTPNKRLDGIGAEPQLIYEAREKAR